MSQPIDKSRLKWSCRRGMLELDSIIMPFFEADFDALTPEQQRHFERLLESSDHQLFFWFMGHGQPQDHDLASLVEHINACHQRRVEG